MTGQEIIEAALARGAEFGANTPASASTMLRRLNAHQETLFAHIAGRSRDYLGRDGVLELVTGWCDTADLDPLPMRVVRVLIEDGGSSGYATGRKVNIVPIDDLQAALAPRATLRDGIIQGYNSELDAVTSIRVYYSKRPATAGMSDTPELPAQYHELFVIDLAKWLVRKTLGMNLTSRDDVVQILQGEYDEMMAELDTHLRNYNFAETVRHGRTSIPR